VWAESRGAEIPEEQKFQRSRNSEIANCKWRWSNKEIKPISHHLFGFGEVYMNWNFKFL